MRYFYPHLTGSVKPPKPKRKLAAWPVASLIVAFMVLAAGGAWAQVAPGVDKAAATRHLFEAVHGNNMAAVQSSIAAGADITATNEWGVTAVDLAVDKGYFNIAHFLLSVRNLRHLEEKPKPPSLPPAASTATKPQPVLPPVKSWAPTVEARPKVSAQTTPAETKASVTAATQSQPDGKPNPFDPSTALPAGDLPIIGKIRRRPDIPEATSPSPPPAPKDFQPPTANLTEPQVDAALEASISESPVPGASKAVKPSALSRFSNIVSGFFLGKKETGKTAPVDDQPIPETVTHTDQHELPPPAAAPEAGPEEGPNDTSAPTTQAIAKGENTGRAGPSSAIPEGPVPQAKTEDSARAQERILDYEEAVPIDGEPKEDFLLANIFERVTSLFSTKGKAETAFPASQSEANLEWQRFESEAEPTPQATGKTAPVDDQPIPETVTHTDQHELPPPAAAPEAGPEEGPNDTSAPTTQAIAKGENTGRAGPSSAIPEGPVPQAKTEDSARAQERILDYEEAVPIDGEPKEDFLLANIFERVTSLFSTKGKAETAFPASQSEANLEWQRFESEAEPTPQATGKTATGESAGITVEQQAKETQFSSLAPSAPVETTTLSAPQQPPSLAAVDADTAKPETPTAAKSPAKAADKAAQESATKPAATESQPVKTATEAKTVQKPAPPAEETARPPGFLERMAKFFRPEEKDKTPRQASKAEPDVDVFGDKWSVSDVQTTRVPPSRRTVKASPAPQITRYLSGKLLAIGQSVRLGSPPSWVKASGRKACIKKRGGALLFCVIPIDWPSSIDPYFQVGNIVFQGSKAVARYDNGTATNFHALFPTGSYDAIIQYFTNRYGRPTKTLMRSIAPLATPRRENPIAMWQSIDTDTRQISTLEVRKFDDGRGGFPDTKHGVVMLYQQWSSPIFPHVSMIELMLLERQG